MTNELLEQLLNEDEGSALDFKRDQYAFVGAGDEQKSELLKDALAFANAWRRSDAYILIGVQEVKGGRSSVVGVTTHLDDAKLQQFVNSKTQRPVDFSYEVFPAEGVQIGVLRISVQQRPLYLTKDYGKLRREAVYIRRGSSTSEASPEEVARMGLSAAQVGRPLPVLDLQFADTARRRKLATEIQTRSTILAPLDASALGQPQARYGWAFTVPDYLVNPHYYQDVVEYVREAVFLASVGFVVENRSSEAAVGVELKITAAVRKGVRVLDETRRLHEPVKHMLSGVALGPGVGGLSVEEFGDHWEASLEVGTVRPRSTVWLEDPLYVGGDHSQELPIEASLYAENLPKPIVFSLKLEIQADRQQMERSHLEAFLKQDSD